MRPAQPLRRRATRALLALSLLLAPALALGALPTLDSVAYGTFRDKTNFFVRFASGTGVADARIELRVGPSTDFSSATDPDLVRLLYQESNGQYFASTFVSTAMTQAGGQAHVWARALSADGTEVGTWIGPFSFTLSNANPVLRNVEAAVTYGDLVVSFDPPNSWGTFTPDGAETIRAQVSDASSLSGDSAEHASSNLDGTLSARQSVRLVSQPALVSTYGTADVHVAFRMDSGSRAGGAGTSYTRLLTVPLGTSVPAPQNLTASTDLMGRVELDWGSVAGASAYEIYRHNQSISNANPAALLWDPIATVTSSNYVDSDLTAEAIADNLIYYVAAVTPDGSTSPVSQISGGAFPPPSPPSVSGDGASYATRAQSISLGVTDVTAYDRVDFYRATTPAFSNSALLVADEVESGFSSASDSAAEVGIPYHYWAIGVIESEDYSSPPVYLGEGLRFGFSAAVTASEAAHVDRIDLAWPAVVGASDIRVERRLPGSTWTEVALLAGDATSYSDTGLAPGETYEYTVTATNAAAGADPAAATSFATGTTDLEVPGAPAGVSATTGSHDSGIEITWQSAQGADGYRVLRASVTDVSAASVVADIAAETTPLRLIDTTAATGENFHYWVRAYNEFGPGDLSAMVTGNWVPLPPAPNTFAASQAAFTDRVALSWEAPSHAVGYDLYRATQADLSDRTLLTTMTGTAYADTLIEAGTAYYYQIAAYNSLGDRGPLSPVRPGFSLVAPQSLTASVDTHTSGVQLGWSAPLGAETYTVYRADPPGHDTLSALTTLAGNAYADTSALPGLDYHYWVVAHSASASSGYSAGALGRRLAGDLTDPPSGVSATTDNEDHVVISWNAVDGAADYVVHRDGEQIATTFDTEFSDASAYPGRRYRYTIAARNVNGTSALSTAAEGMRPSTPANAHERNFTLRVPVKL